MASEGLATLHRWQTLTGNLVLDAFTVDSEEGARKLPGRKLGRFASLGYKDLVICRSVQLEKKHDG